MKGITLTTVRLWSWWLDISTQITLFTVIISLQEYGPASIPGFDEPEALIRRWFVSLKSFNMIASEAKKKTFAVRLWAPLDLIDPVTLFGSRMDVENAPLGDVSCRHAK